MTNIKLIVLITVLFAGVFFTETMYASNHNELEVVKKGGKFNRQLGRVTYNTIITKYNREGHLYYQYCGGRGNEICPPVAIITVGSNFSMEINQAIAEAESLIYRGLQKGITSGIYSSGDFTIIYDEATFAIDEKGNVSDAIEYHMVIKY